MTERPPILVRSAIGVAGAAMLLFSAALMLSDRAPSAIKRLFGDFGRRLSARIDADGRARSALEEGQVEGDSIVHLGLWSLAVIFVALAIWTWRGLAVTAVLVFMFSLAVEAGQGVFSSTRTVELRDVVFNLLGVILGVVISSIFLLIWTRFARAAATRS